VRGSPNNGAPESSGEEPDPKAAEAIFSACAARIAFLLAVLLDFPRLPERDIFHFLYASDALNKMYS